jgi:hypothetical protein
MFEQATRLKLRFETSRGMLSVEDLWDLPLSSQRGVSLDEIAISLHNALKHDTISFVDDTEKPDPRLQLSFDLVKHVIDVRKAENKVAAEARAKAEQKQKILGIIARKEDMALEGMDIDKLREMIGTL